MGILSNIGSSINKAYTNIDKTIFKGALPGGAEKQTNKTTTPTPIANNPFIPPQQSPLPISTPSAPTTSTTPTTSTSSSRSSGGSSSSGVVQTPTGGVSTAFPERYTEVYQGIPKYTEPTETNPLGLAPQTPPIPIQSRFQPTLTTTPPKQTYSDIINQYEYNGIVPTAKGVANKVYSDTYGKYSEEQERYKSQQAKQSADILRQGKKEYYGGQDYSTLLPYQKRGTAVVTKQIPFSDEELQANLLSPGVPLEQVRRQEENIKEKVFQDYQNAEVEVKPIVQQRIDEEVSKSKDYLNNLFNELQQKVNTGKLSVEEANKILFKESKKQEEDISNKVNKTYSDEINKRLDPKITGYSKEANKVLNELNKKREIQSAIAYLPATVASGAALSLLVSGGAVGTAVGVGSGLLLAKDVGKQVIEGDTYGLARTGIDVGGFMAGGLVAGGIKSYKSNKLESSKVNEAYSRATVESTIRSENVQGIIGQFNLNQQQKFELNKLVDRGLSVRAVQFKVKPNQNFPGDSKYIGDVRGNYIEVVARDGTVIQRNKIGDFVVNTNKGKTISKSVIERSIGMIEGDTSTSYSQIIEGKWNNKGFKPVNEVRTVEQSQQTDIQVVPEKRAVMRQSQTDFSLIKDYKKTNLPTESVGFLKAEKGSTISYNEIMSGGLIGEIDTARLQGLAKRTTRAAVRSEREPIGRATSTEIDLISKPVGTRLDVGGPGWDAPNSVMITQKSLTAGRSEFIRTKTKSPTTKSYKEINESPESLSLLDMVISKDIAPTKAKGSISYEEPLSDLPTMVGGGGKGTSLFSDNINRGQPSGRTSNLLAEESQSGALSKSQSLSRTSGFDEAILKASSEVMSAEIKESPLKGYKTKIKESLIGSNIQEQLSYSSSLNDNKQFLDNPFSLLSLSVESIDTSQIESPKSTESLFSGQVESLKQEQIQQTKIKQINKFNPPSVGIGVPEPPITKFPILFTFGLDSDETNTSQVSTNQGYDVYGLKNARNNAKRRWIKINDKPLTHEDAKDIGAFAIDNSISATFEIRKSKEAPEPIENALLYGYFADNIQKFRDYKIKKGMKIPMNERFIEKAKDRLDTQGEIKEISLEKVKAEINKVNSFRRSGGMRGLTSGFSLTSGDKIEASPNLSRNESKKTSGFSLIGTKNKKAKMIKPQSNSFKKNPSLVTSDSIL